MAVNLVSEEFMCKTPKSKILSKGRTGGYGLHNRCLTNLEVHGIWTRTHEERYHLESGVGTKI
jgi:hypothetical protein